jgi:hypothetical protein
MAADTLAHLLALHVTAADAQDRAHVKQLAERVQGVTGESIGVAFVDQGDTGDQPAQEAGGPWHASRGGETARGQERLCTVATPLGGRE